jgi:excisionase family DNA binding protein
MPDPTLASNADRSSQRAQTGRITVDEIARRLHLGRLAIYRMLEQGLLPGVRVGRRWIITQRSFQEWERTCGMRPSAGLPMSHEVRVLN